MARSSSESELGLLSLSSLSLLSSLSDEDEEEEEDEEELGGGGGSSGILAKQNSKTSCWTEKVVSRLLESDLQAATLREDKGATWSFLAMATTS